MRRIAAGPRNPSAGEPVRARHRLRPMMHSRRTALAAILVPAMLLAACSAAAPASPVPPAGGTPSAVAPPTDGVPPIASAPGTLPDPGGAAGGGGSTGGGLIPNPQPSIVSPTTGLTGIHALNATLLQPSVNGRDVAVKVAWWSGIAPCSVLAGVDVARDGATFTLTVREGAAQQGVACSEIAMYKATIVDLGRLDPGTYTIKATGDAPAVTVTVAA
jgi:hypothetical protein